MVVEVAPAVGLHIQKMVLAVGVVKLGEIEMDCCLEKSGFPSGIGDLVFWEWQVFDWLAFEPQPLRG